VTGFDIDQRKVSTWFRAARTFYASRRPKFRKHGHEYSRITKLGWTAIRPGATAPPLIATAAEQKVRCEGPKAATGGLRIPTHT